MAQDTNNMVNNPVVGTQPAEQPPKKRKKKSSTNRLFSRLADANVEFVGGMAEAVGSGVRAFGEEMPERNAKKVNWSKTLVNGVSEGSARLLTDLSDVVKKVADVLTEEDEDEEEEDE